MIIRHAHDYDVVIHLNNKKGMQKKLRLADGSFITLTYPTDKKYFLRVGDTITIKSDGFEEIEGEYVKECKKLQDSDDHGRIDIVKHKLIANKVFHR
jgi:hypothetical protein